MIWPGIYKLQNAQFSSIRPWPPPAMQVEPVEDAHFFFSLEHFQPRVLQVDNTVFRVHQQRLIEVSDKFRTLLLVERPLLAPGDADIPVVLQLPGLDPAGFRDFLRVIYYGHRDDFWLSPGGWLGVLLVAHIYSCPSVFQACLQALGRRSRPGS
ncbi:hypothetical protein PENSPDRAFT_150176 [Peniophora sp. CONT]|nr:hypothetical protein PENSPDRAFT_150176 [Peniophora sp. CONT]